MPDVSPTQKQHYWYINYVENQKRKKEQKTSLLALYRLLSYSYRFQNTYIQKYVIS